MGQPEVSVLAGKPGGVLTEDYLLERARRGSAEKSRRVLAKSPHVPPLPGDELPEDWDESWLQTPGPEPAR
jgi:hypothetical protein